MRILPASVLALSFLISLTAVAEVTLQSVSGITRRETIENVEHIYAGAAGVCDDTSPCNTCLAGTGLNVCNESSIGPNVILTIEGTVTATTVTTPRVVVRSVVKNQPVALAASVLEGERISASIEWRTLCGLHGGTNCDASFSDTLQFGVGSDSTEPTDKIEMKIIFGVAPSTSPTVTACPPGGAGVSGEGVCYFQVDRGDGKVYIADLGVSSDYPITGGSSSEVKFSDVIFYFEPVLDGESDATAIARLSTSSSSAVIGMSGASDNPLSDDRITGLSNGQRYCFTFGNRDNTGNIYRFANVASAADYPDSNLICAVPEEVVGLLDDKKCFIATAAWGSPMAPRVRDLREFRDRFLMTSAAGKSFVRWYYSHGPGWAEWISKHEQARVVARTMLWPVWFFARLMNLTGGWALLALMGLALGGTILVRQRRAA